MESTLTRTILFTVTLVFAWNALPASAAPENDVLELDKSSSMKDIDSYLPEPAPLPELELPDAAPLFSGLPAHPERPGAVASDETVVLPIIDDRGSAQRAALPTHSNAGTPIESPPDTESKRRLAHPGASAATMKPPARPDAEPPGGRLRQETMPRAKDPGRSEAFPGSGWLAVLLSAGLIGVALTVGMTLPGKRRTAGETEFVDQLPKAFLNDLGGISEKPSYELGESPTMIGRIGGGEAGDVNYVVIPEPTVGRRHALIEFRKHSFWLADHDSLNGTFVNGERIEGNARLKHGDRVRFHRYEFEFLLLDMFESDGTRPGQTASSGPSRAANGDGPIRPPAPEDAARAAFR